MTATAFAVCYVSLLNYQSQCRRTRPRRCTVWLPVQLSEVNEAVNIIQIVARNPFTSIITSISISSSSSSSIIILLHVVRWEQLAARLTEGRPVLRLAPLRSILAPLLDSEYMSVPSQPHPMKYAAVDFAAHLSPLPFSCSLRRSCPLHTRS